MMKCQLPKWQGCCCQCRYHVPDYGHPITTGTVIFEQVGWICMPPECKGAFSGWPEHGLCEMFLKYDCKTSDGRTAFGSIESTIGAKIVASAAFLDFGITDVITDKHREYPASYVIPIKKLE